MSVRLLAEAEDEAWHAATWYEARREGLGDDFLNQLTRALERIEANPRLYGAVPGCPAGREVRRATLDRFPYAVIYEVRVDEVLVLAVAHGRRRPGYWLRRGNDA